jgi:hypothetical protein
MNKNIKSIIVEDWQNAFPQLTVYSYDKLYKIVGCLIVGIELTKLPRSDEYRPHFVCYPLWKDNIKDCLSGPLMLKEYYNKKGLQFSIPFEKHGTYFSEAVESVKKHTLLSFDGDIISKKLFSVIDEYSKTPPLSAAPNSYLQAMLQEAKLEIALYVNVTEAEIIFEQISKRNWDINHFKLCGADVSKWLQKIGDKIKLREALLNKISINKEDIKLSKLNRSEFIV